MGTARAHKVLKPEDFFPVLADVNLFAPALIFDTMRYYLTNTLYFFLWLFRLVEKPQKPLDENQLSALPSES